MMGTRLFVVSVAMLAAGCGDDATTTITCGTGTSGALAVDSPVEVTGEGGADLRGASIAAEAKTTLPSGDVSIECADDIVPAGYTALGPAVTFGAEGTWSDRPFVLTLPYKSARAPKTAQARDVRIVAKRAGQDAPFFPAVSNRLLDQENAYASRASFRAGELTTYQVVVAENAGELVEEEFKWNAIIGISMGGFAANSIKRTRMHRARRFAPAS